MRFFDYLFYLIYKLYSNKEKGAASSSAGIIGGLQAANILSILIMLTIVFQKTFLNTMISLFVIIIFQIGTYVRYIYNENHSIQKVENKWANVDESKRIAN